MSRFLVSVGMSPGVHDASFAVLDTAIHEARLAHKRTRLPVYVSDNASRDGIARWRGVATEDGWRWLEPCVKCKAGVTKDGKSCGRCGGTLFARVDS